MEVLFLDIDGVLCLGSITRQLDSACINNLVSITKAVPDLVIVLSSDWRKEEILQDHLAYGLAQHGIERPVHKTRTLKQSNIDWSRYEGLNAGVRGALRSEEIRDWLECYPVEKYAAIDDTTLYLDSGFFQTQLRVGLTPEIAHQIIEHLTKEN